MHNDLFVMINGCVIDRVKEVVFLGVILDKHISWKPHTSHVAIYRKISNSNGRLLYTRLVFFFQNVLYVNYTGIIPKYIPIHIYFYFITVRGRLFKSRLTLTQD